MTHTGWCLYAIGSSHLISSVVPIEHTTARAEGGASQSVRPYQPPYRSSKELSLTECVCASSTPCSLSFVPGSRAEDAHLVLVSPTKVAFIERRDGATRWTFEIPKKYDVALFWPLDLGCAAFTLVFCVRRCVLRRVCSLRVLVACCRLRAVGVARVGVEKVFIVVRSANRASSYKMLVVSLAKVWSDCHACVAVRVSSEVHVCVSCESM